MPAYNYKCKESGRMFEVFRHLSELDKEVKCPNCGSEKTESVFLFLILKGKPWRALGMENLNLLSLVQDKVEVWAELDRIN